MVQYLIDQDRSNIIPNVNTEICPVLVNTGGVAHVEACMSTCSIAGVDHSSAKKVTMAVAYAACTVTGVQ